MKMTGCDSASSSRPFFITSSTMAWYVPGLNVLVENIAFDPKYICKNEVTKKEWIHSEGHHTSSKWRPPSLNTRNSHACLCASNPAGVEL